MPEMAGDWNGWAEEDIWHLRSWVWPRGGEKLKKKAKLKSWEVEVEKPRGKKWQIFNWEDSEEGFEDGRTRSSLQRLWAGRGWTSSSPLPCPYPPSSSSYAPLCLSEAITVDGFQCNPEFDCLFRFHTWIQCNGLKLGHSRSRLDVT